ncbi:MAG: class I SAM-dependent methyltransferase [Anaerolineae bacterium]|nr:class I SAM-dependent methyltransferase [Anaerolineae bacterium]
MTIKDAFDKAAKAYDAARKQLIPCFDDFYGTALEIITLLETAPTRVLDLGAGTGLFASLVAQCYPNAEFTLFDLSDAMLEQAKQRFGNDNPKIKYVVKDYAAEPIDGQYDLIISALSIHHLSDAEKETLFQKIFSSLNDNGLFINADQVLGKTPAVEKIYREMWLKQVKARGVSDATLASALERMKEDKMSTLSQQLTWLKQANFADVNCWYKNFSFAVYSGRKYL